MRRSDQRIRRHCNQLMSPEAGITDLQAALPNLSHRLNAALADTQADTSLPATPEAVPATPADACQNSSQQTSPPLYSPKCQLRSTSPAFPPNSPKGLVRASSAGSAAWHGASLSAASPVPCAARPSRKPAATTPRRRIREPPRPAGCVFGAGRAPLSPLRCFRRPCSRICSPPAVSTAPRPRAAPISRRELFGTAGSGREWTRGACSGAGRLPAGAKDCGTERLSAATGYRKHFSARR